MQEEVLACIKKYEPDLVTLSPRCGPWSPVSEVEQESGEGDGRPRRRSAAMALCEKSVAAEDEGQS